MNNLVMKNSMRRGALAALASVALLIPTFSGASAHAAPGDGVGDLSISMVDTLGRPVVGQVILMSTDDSASIMFPQYDEEAGRPGTLASQYSTANAAPGGYGQMSVAPWGGLICEGISPCSPMILGAPDVPPTVTSVVNVTDDGLAATHTTTFPLPATITGSPTVGGVLSANLSAPQKALADAFKLAFSSSSIPISIPTDLTMQWRRDGVAIPGATSSSYTLTTDDAAHTIDVALAYPEFFALYFASLGGSGADLSSYVVPGLRIGRAPTRTTADLFRKKIATGRSTGLRIDVTAAGEPVTDGTVTIKIDKKKLTKPIRNGSARVALPKLMKAGTYKIAVTYAGTTTYLPSSSSTLKLKVTKKK